MKEPISTKSRSPFDGGPSFTLGNRLLRLVWGVTWFIFASWTPSFAHPWRRMVLRIFGAKVGEKSDVRGSAKVWFPPNLIIGDRSVVAEDVDLYNQAVVKIGSRTIISQKAYICASGHDIDHPAFQLIAEPIVIGSNVWLASDSFVGPGVTIHDGSVLGARSVTFKDMESNGVYVGYPAKKIRMRVISDE